MIPETSKIWDTLSGNFDTQKDSHDIDFQAADNILIAWPRALDFIRRNTPKTKQNPKALDYGCGTGGFAKKLQKIGFTVLGMDSSQEMINVAMRQLQENVRFIFGDMQTVLAQGKFDLITAMMVFQFIENYEETLRSLVTCMEDKGLLALTVFNPAWIRRCVEVQHPEFSDFSDTSCTGRGVMHFDADRQCPVFIREAKTYDDVLLSMGFTKDMEEYPPFTEEYLRIYKDPAPTDVPEFLVLGYRR